MSSPTPWPQINWTSQADVGALLERVREVALLARRFETALEEAGSADELDVSQLSDPLARWDEQAAEVFRYTGLGEGLEITPEQAPELLAELAERYSALGTLRLEMIRKLPAKAAKCLVSRESTVKVDENLLEVTDGPMPALSPLEMPEQVDVGLLGGESSASFAEWSEPKRLPVTAEEVRSRQTAENKLLPEKLSLAGLLTNQPSDWVTTIYETLGIVKDGEEEMTTGSRSAMQRGAIHRFLSDADSLQGLVTALGNEERELLSALIGADGMMPYRQVTDRWGLDEADGFYWRERPPSCALAWLRRNGLAFVGSKNYRLMVVVPADLSKRIGEMLELSVEEGG